MKFLGYSKVLCLSPHPDDIEYSMLGTIMRCHETSFSVFCMTKGGTRCLDNTDSSRLAEVKEAWRVIDVNNVTLCFSDCDLLEDKDKDPGWVNYLENRLIKDNIYDCILLPTKEDSQFEHRFVNGLGPALVRHSPTSLIEYRTPSTLNSWQPNLFVSIDEFYNKKLEALKRFTSQQGKGYFAKSALDMFHTNFQCGKKGINIIEQFRIMEMYAMVNK